MDEDLDSPSVTSDYLSPRSKVARMLADIDEAPTPSPTHCTGTQQYTVHRSPRPYLKHVNTVLKHSSPNHGLVDDLEDSPIKPKGRAAQRMLRPLSNELNDEEDLYSATPVRSLRSFATTPDLRCSVAAPSLRGEGLFVSPAKSCDIESEDDLPSNPLRKTSRLTELVAAKRAERLAREAVLARSEQPDESPHRAGTSNLPEAMVEVGDTLDLEADNILSDAARPTRKASKKAILEMERETQRLAREQALAHQMKTKKKFSKTDLFARFNFRQPNQAENEGTSSSAPNSDGAEDRLERLPREPVSTPPSSPPTPWDTQKAMVDRGALSRMLPMREDSISSLSAMQIDDDLPEVEDIIRQSRAAKAIARPCPDSPTRNASMSRPHRVARLAVHAEEEDDDLDIVQPMPQHLKVFDRVKPISKLGEAHSKAIHTLKHLAHLAQDTVPRGRKVMKAVIPNDYINAQLLATANTHARQAQQQRLMELQAKGVVVMSAEEQEKEADQIENLLEKARQEAEELRKKEKAAARKENDFAASDDEDEDAEWHESDSEADAEFEEEEDEDEVQDHSLLDDVADDTLSVNGSDDLDMPLEHGTNEPSDHHNNKPVALGKRRARIIVDDEDEDDQQPVRTNISNTQGEDLFAAFGFGDDGPRLMSPSQAFAATMKTPTQFSQYQGGMSVDPFVTTAERPPPPTFGDVHQQSDERQNQFVPASQLQEESQQVVLDWETQMPETPVPEAKVGNIAMLETPGWEPSQDAGLPSPWAAARRGELLFAPAEHLTQSTVRERISQSPDIRLRRGRLAKRMRQVNSEDDDEHSFSALAAPKSKNAFAEMQKRRLEAMNAVDRAAAEKETKGMMDDQAEESEDEYAGLGGDDSNMIAPETEEDRAMIDESNIEIDEREAARFYAERQRITEEEATSKLFKDLTTGALRRRQGVGWELDEDEDELAARRRQMRLREEARKRRLLLQDDNVKGLLEGKGDNKGREAFLRTIGDDDDVLDVDLESEHVIPGAEESQEDMPLHEISTNTRQMSDSQDMSGNKRHLTDSQDMPPSKVRRVREHDGFGRPTSMLQVRQSLSFLLDEPDHILYGPTVSENLEDDEDDAFTEVQEDEVELELSRDNDGGLQEMPPPPLPIERLPASQRRTPAKSAIIDRLSLRRGSSSSNSSGWSAWSTGSGTSKAPSLLRKATSNLSASNVNDRGVSHGSNADRGVSTSTRMGGSKKSSLAYQSRAEEWKISNERAQKKKEEAQRKMAELKRKCGESLAGGLQSGQWE